jgi:hypothetical protein
MLTKCSNPDCETPFDFCEGRLIRFSGALSNDQPCENQRLIQHFWLCGKCAGLYLFEYESGIGVRLKPRDRELSEVNPSHFVAAA